MTATTENPRIVGRDDATTADLYELACWMIRRLSVLENVTCMLAVLELDRHNRATPETAQAVEQILECLVDYAADMQEAAQQARADMEFLTAKE